MKVSVITPTYNRAYILPQCYKSLCEQTSKDFEWIVVDDGSTDDTEPLVKGFIAETNIDIKYYWQENGGKHRAHNTAVKHATGELTVCLDSDDQLAPNAIKRAIEIWQSQSSDTNIGILAPRGSLRSHNIICSELPVGISCATMTELRDRYHFEGDTVLFFKTSLLKEHQFREFDSENFLTENNLYCELDCYGSMILEREPLYFCEYRPDGLSAKYHKLLYKNPKGTADTYYRMALAASTYIAALKYAIIANAYNNMLPPDNKIKFNRKIILMNVARVFAPLFYLKYIKNIAE